MNFGGEKSLSNNIQDFHHINQIYEQHELENYYYMHLYVKSVINNLNVYLKTILIVQ